jgi:hypothetical protein
VPRTRWAGYDNLKTLALARAMAAPSDDHEPFRWNMLVRVTPKVLDAYLNWHIGNTMPADTLLVAEHWSRQGTAQGPYYFALRNQNGWQFGAATADGWLLDTNNACIACHSEAPADHVFGLSPLATSPNDTKRPDGG